MILEKDIKVPLGFVSLCSDVLLSSRGLIGLAGSRETSWINKDIYCQLMSFDQSQLVMCRSGQ